MAEPINTWQAFRSYYARQNPGTSVQQASEAWTKHKERHNIVTGTTKKSSSRRESPKKSPTKGKQHALSPPKSPTRTTKISKSSKTHKSPPKSPPKTIMHMLVQPSFTGIPKELRNVIASNLPSQGIASLQAVSKATKKHTEQELARLCQEQPTILEIQSYIKDMLAHPSWSIAFFDADSLRTDNIKLTIYKSKNGSYHKYVMKIHHNNDTGEYRSILQYYNRKYLSIEKDLNHIKTLIDPVSLRKIYLRRKSCNQSDYLATVKQYALNILRPFLLPFLTPEQIEDLILRSVDQEDHVVVPNIEDPVVPHELYLRALKVRIARAWLDYHQLPTDINSLNPVIVIEEIPDIITDIWNNLKIEEQPSLYTTTDFVKYVRKILENKQSLDFAFLSIKDELTDVTIIVEAYKIKAGIVKGTHYTLKTDKLLGGITGAPDPKITTKEYSLPNLLHILDTKILPGVLDPATVKKLLLANGMDKQTITPIIDREARLMLRNVSRLTTNMIYRQIVRVSNASPTFRGQVLIAIMLELFAIWLGNPVVKDTKSKKKNSIPATLANIEQMFETPIPITRH